jgi:methionyl-tRNA formyltransferase
MRIVYMGTPEFARPPLVALCESRHEVLAVVTGPDKHVGRGHKLVSTPVKQEAEARSLPVLTPTRLKDNDLRNALAELKADLFVVIAFRILPETLFTLPRLGSVNIHGSLLPAYRGAAPINWAIINGEVETGLTSFFLKKDVDTGNMILQEKTNIGPEDSYDLLASRMSAQAGPFLLATLEAIERGDHAGVAQDSGRASFAPKLTPSNSMLDWGFPAEYVHNFVRGLCSKPGAYTYFRGKRLKVLECRVSGDAQALVLRPGTILPDKRRLLVQCANSVVELARIVPEGKGEMDGAAFLNGFRPRPDEVLGDLSVGEEEKR